MWGKGDPSGEEGEGIGNQSVSKLVFVLSFFRNSANNEDTLHVTITSASRRLRIYGRIACISSKSRELERKREGGRAW